LGGCATLIGAGSFLLPHSNTVDTATPTTEVSQQSTGSTTEAAPAAVNSLKPGEKLSEGGIEYGLISLSKKTQIGNSYAGKKAEPGSSYFIIKYSLLNKGKSTATIAADNFKLDTADGTQFSPDSEAATAMMMSGDKSDFLLSELQPGVAKKAAAIFLVPTSTAKHALFWEVPSGEAFGSPIKVQIQ
jgi:hypothetical protein